MGAGQGGNGMGEGGVGMGGEEGRRGCEGSRAGKIRAGGGAGAKLGLEGAQKMTVCALLIRSGFCKFKMSSFRMALEQWVL